ncbi:MAG: DUF2341 domain-containing protein [Candidatus Thermoplasmatota archaeon]
MKAITIAIVFLIAPILLTSSEGHENNNLRSDETYGSVWTEATSADFNDGVFNNTKVVGDDVVLGGGCNGLKYRKPVSISNSNSVLADHQVLVNLDTTSLISTGKMRSDCGDIRFTYSDGSTLINYWLESRCNTGSTKIWVKVPSIPASSTKTIYVYYGDTKLASVSNYTKTLELFSDDFSSDPNTNNKWEIYRNKGDTANEFVWDNTNEFVYLAKAVNSRGIMAFAKVQGYPIFVNFNFLAGGGSGADGIGFGFDKNITPYRTNNRAEGGGYLGLRSGYSVDSDGFALELDNFDNGPNDPSENYIAIARTNADYGIYPRPANNYYKTRATEDNSWHTINLKISGDYSSVDYVKLDETTILSGIEISKLGFGYFGFGGSTGDLNNNHILDNVVIYYSKYTFPEPKITIGAEEPLCAEEGDEGTYISSIKDTGISNTPLEWLNISWSAAIPAGTSIKFNTRTSSDGVNWGSWSSDYTSSPSTITSPSNRYIQYMATLTTTDLSVTPTLSDVTITYNRKATVPILSSPLNNSYVKTTTPTFQLYSYDDDLDLLRYKIELSKDNFSSIYRVYDFSIAGWSANSYSSGSFASYKVQDADELDEGFYYWRAYANDSSGFSSASQTNYFCIDVTSPIVSLFLINYGANTTNSLIVNLSIKAHDELSGLDKISFSNDNNTWSSWEIYSENKLLWNLAEYGGTILNCEKVVYVRVIDRAGNIGYGKSDIMVKKIKPGEPIQLPTCTTGLVIGIIIALSLIIALLSIIAIRRKIRMI